MASAGLTTLRKLRLDKKRITIMDLEKFCGAKTVTFTFDFVQNSARDTLTPPVSKEPPQGSGYDA